MAHEPMALDSSVQSRTLMHHCPVQRRGHRVWQAHAVSFDLEYWAGLIGPDASNDRGGLLATLGGSLWSSGWSFWAC